MRRQVKDEKKSSAVLCLFRLLSPHAILTFALGSSLLKSIALGYSFSILQKAVLLSYQNHPQFFPFSPPPNPQIEKILAIIYASSFSIFILLHYSYCDWCSASSTQSSPAIHSPHHGQKDLQNFIWQILVFACWKSLKSSYCIEDEIIIQIPCVQDPVLSCLLPSL